MGKMVIGLIMVGTCVAATASPDPNPRRFPDPPWPSEDSSSPALIASFSVAEFGADSSGAADATAAFQRAMDVAHDAGGAVVYVPPGRYRFDGNLEIPTGVTLRGARHVDRKPRLLAYAGRGEENGPSFIRMHPCSGLRGLAIYYPEQRAEAIVPYPWAIEQVGGDNVTVMDMELANPYQGIKIGPQGNELHLIRNVAGTPLKTGIFIDSTFDIGRIDDVRFAPEHWMGFVDDADAPRPVSESALRTWLREHGRGIVMGRSDWEYMRHVHLKGYRTGLTVTRGERGKTETLGASNAQFTALHIEDCAEPVRIEETNHIGLAFSGCTFRTSTEPIRCTETFTQGAVQFNRCRFVQAGSTALDLGGSGGVSFQDCRFVQEGEEPFAIRARCAALGMLDCAFEGSTPAIVHGDTSVKAFSFEGTQSAAGLVRGDGAFPGVLTRASLGEGTLDALDVGLDFVGRRQLPRIPDVGPALYVVEAPSSGDATASIQARLEEARERGGTVYLPAGDYAVHGALTVPSGVELRGIWDVPHHTVGKGTVLLATGGKGDADGTPLITLEAHAGVRGITVYYPEQDFRDVQPYPWTVQGLGEGVYAINVTMANTYQGIDFASHPCDGHLVDYAAGAPLKTGIRVSGENGMVRDMQFNPHFWSRCDYPGNPDETSPEFRQLWDRMIGEMDALVVAGARNERLINNFVFASRNGLRFTARGGVAPTATVIGHGSDAADVCVRIDAAGAEGIRLVNLQGAAFLGKTDKAYLAVGPEVKGPVLVENALLWGQPETGVISEGEDETLKQVHFVETGDTGVDVRGGRLTLESAIFRTPCAAEVRQRGGEVSLRGNIAADFLDVIGPDGPVEVTKSMGTSLLRGSLDGWTDEQRAHYRLSFGDGAALEFRDRWYGPEPAGEWNNEGKKQWSKPGAKVYLPVLPNTRYALALETRVPNEAVSPGAGLYVGSNCVLPFTEESLGTLIGEFVSGEERYIVLDVRCNAWRPVDVYEGSQDERELGIAVRSLVLRAEGSGAPVYDANAGRWSGKD